MNDDYSVVEFFSHLITARNAAIFFMLQPFA